MKILLFLLFTTATLLGQGGSYCSYMTGDPRLYANKFGLVAYYGLFDTNSITLNGAGESKVIDKSWKAGRLENLLVQSAAFSTTWARSGINAFGATDTGAAGAGSFANTARTTDPLGGNTADFIQEDSTAATTHVLSQTISFTAGISYNFSCYIKQSGRTGVVLRLPSSAFGTAQDGKYDLVGGTSGVRSGAPIVSIESIGDSWYRCNCSATATTTTTGDIQIYASSNDGTSVIYSGDNTSGLFLWGAQLRRSTSSSTYYATTTVVEDASRDLLQGTAANQPLVSRADNKGNLLVQSEPLLANVSAKSAGVTQASFSEGGLSNGVQFPATTTDQWAYVGVNGGINTANSYRLSIYVVMDDGSAPNPGAPGPTTDFTLIVAGGSGGSLSVVNISGTLYNVSATISASTGSINNNGIVRYSAQSGKGFRVTGYQLTELSWDADYIKTVGAPVLPGLNGKTTGYFDGANHFLKTAAFTLNQPTTVIWVGKQVTWTDQDTLVDGNGSSSLRIYQLSASPQLFMYAGTSARGPQSPALGAWFVGNAIFNGVDSLWSYNNSVASTGNPGTTAAGGMTLGAKGDATGFSNIQVSQVLLFNRVLLTNEVTAIQRWAQGIGGTALAF